MVHRPFAPAMTEAHAGATTETKAGRHEVANVARPRDFGNRHNTRQREPDGTRGVGFGTFQALFRGNIAMNSLSTPSIRPAPARRLARPFARSALVLACCSALIAQAQVQSPGVDVAAATPARVAAAAPQPAGPLLQLVAPIALDPDPLVAQILAASTYPLDVVQAARWVRNHPGLQGQPLADAVNAFAWDPSVKALTAFPAVLDNMDTNLSWTSALGDAYVNRQGELMDAIQVLRRRAQASGNLQSTSQQIVTTQDQAVAIEPVDPEVVYLPAYDPWVVYGAPLAAYPGWVGLPGTYYDGPGLFFGAGLGIGLFAGYGFGWYRWGFDWRARRAIFDHAPYVAHNHFFASRGNFDRGVPRVGGVAPFHGSFASVRPGAFGGAFHGGGFRGDAFHGGEFHGGEFHGGGFEGGGFHGGGFGGGGGHR